MSQYYNLKSNFIRGFFKHNLKSGESCVSSMKQIQYFARCRNSWENERRRRTAPVGFETYWR